MVGEEGERVVEKLDGRVETSVRCFRRPVEATGGKLRAPHMNGDRLRVYIRRRRGVEGAEVPERIAREGVPAEIHAGDNPGRELADGNHRSAAKYGGKVLTKATAEVAHVRVIAFPVSRTKGIMGL